MAEGVATILAGVLGAVAAGAFWGTFSAKDPKKGVSWFVATALATLAALMVLGGGARELTFAFIGLVVIVGAAFAIRAESLMHAALFLTISLLGVAGIYLTLGAEFLAAIQVLVYVGAVITLILFTIMLTTPAEAAPDLKDLELPFGVHVERVETVQTVVPAFTGVGPFKTLRETNPRKPTTIPGTLEGVALTDEKIGSHAEAAPRPKEGEEDSA
ncbi:MAG TPA: NADH-quinone oxidoreductase subunit J [Candidatus Thermoplasmatota archaeon]|nr:NADH-quinone oxidoreductase subunit J [Candidatus Thermoplasmatota archaeon]